LIEVLILASVFVWFARSDCSVKRKDSTSFQALEQVDVINACRLFSRSACELAFAA
jgi:hypothetical protein